MRHTSASLLSSTGRNKAEQVVLEFLYKAAELIVQSRVNFHAEPDVRRTSRRARFNLDIEEVQGVRDAMTAWKEDVTLPLAIDIFWDAGSHKVLLERWSVTFAADNEGPITQLSSTQDVIQQLKEVCKRISILLRALFSFMRQLPAHRLFTQSYPSMLSYTMHATPPRDATRAFETQRVATSGYSFIPIATPIGVLKVTVVYRRDCDRFTEQQELVAPSPILQDNCIIQDYVPGSPELASASAPVMSVAMVSSPMRGTDARTGSFVPVTNAQLLNEDKHRRSSPRSIPESLQQQLSTSRLNDSEEGDDVQLQPGMSKPMAIPRASSKGGVAVAVNRDMEAIIQHAHSYGGENDILRSTIANPNVAAAPYGYGNVAIERDHERLSSPSLAFQQRQQQLWEGHADRHDTELGLNSSHRLSDEAPVHINSSTGGAAYHCMSTPPRHPKTVTLLRHGSPALAHKLSPEHFPPGSLERFSLDSGPPSQVQQHAFQQRKTSFSGAFVSDTSASSPVTTFTRVHERSQRLEDAKSATLSTTNPEAMAINPQALPHAQAAGLPEFSASPPFQVNPSELLSLSPGYAYTKSQLRSSSSNVPTFVTTDRCQRTAHNEKGSSPARMIALEHRSFSPDFGFSGVTTWGFSPDTPDLFGFALTESDGGRESVRPRNFLGSENEPSDDQDYDLDSMILPFVINDGVSSASTTVDSVLTGANSTLSRSSGTSLNSASVGNFLYQLKNAPRLSKSSSTLAPSMSPGEADQIFDAKEERAVPSMFDDELAGFRNLRDELAHLL